MSHTGPNKVNIGVFSNVIGGSEKYGDQVALLNDQIDDLIICKQWWCGHWPMDRYYYDETRKQGINIYTGPLKY